MFNHKVIILYLIQGIAPVTKKVASMIKIVQV